VSVTLTLSRAAQKKGKAARKPSPPPKPIWGGSKPVARSVFTGTAAHGSQTNGIPSTSTVAFVTVA